MLDIKPILTHKSSYSQPIYLQPPIMLFTIISAPV